MNVTLNELACWTCRKKWWQCKDRISYILLDYLGSKLVRCSVHEDVDKCRRISEMRMMLNFVTERKAELERKLKEEESNY